LRETICAIRVKPSAPPWLMRETLTQLCALRFLCVLCENPRELKNKNPRCVRGLLFNYLLCFETLPRDEMLCGARRASLRTLRGSSLLQTLRGPAFV
jgi:hypothetical protein